MTAWFNRPLVGFLLSTLVAGLFIFPNLTRPSAQVFDEFHYVRAALQVLDGSPTSNWEHPPHAKQWIALGITLFGDRPLGWRFFSALLGSLSVGLLYLLMIARGRMSPSQGFFGVALLLFSFPHFVLSRTGMLDAYFVFYVLLSSSLVLYRHKHPALMWLAWVAAGLALACKWSALFMLIPFWVFALETEKGLVASLSEELKPRRLFGGAALLLLAYFAPLVPQFPHPLAWIESVQIMWSGQLRVSASHPYTSEWWQWPLLTRPMWLHFAQDPPGSGLGAGVFLGGNPLIFWGGAITALISVARWPRRVRWAYVWFFLTLIWAVVPRKISFFHYVYPASLCLGPLLVEAILLSLQKRTELTRWITFGALATVSGVLFFYFYPILTGELIELSDLRYWMWFPSWL